MLPCHQNFRALCISQLQLRPFPPRLLWGICPSCQSRGWGISKFCAARGPGICQPRGQTWAFNRHAVSYQRVITQRILLEKKQIGSFLKDGKKLSRFVKACSRFYACISSLLIKPELHSGTRKLSTWINVFFGYWIKFLLILFEEHLFIFIKLFIAVNFTVTILKS